LQKTIATTVKGHPGGPITQSKEAVKALLIWRGRACDPMPEFVEMGKGESRLVLVLSNKRDAYYTTIARACSCPAHAFSHGSQCDHQRKYFPEPAMDSIRSEAMEPMEA
jgi:folate-dependent phosphoribosylglycinamide formyltransferase PurN